MPRPRILYVLAQYPMLCETYIQSEIDELRANYDVRVVSFHKPKGADVYNENPAPYRVVRNVESAIALARQFKPDIIHSHWMITSSRVLEIAQALAVPFTIRAHSFDTLHADYMHKWFAVAKPTLQALEASKLLLGVVAFPMSRQFLVDNGIPDAKIRDDFPPVNVDRFLDRSPNGEGVLNVGACLPKKCIRDFLKLATKVPDQTFDLYPVGYDTKAVEEQNAKLGNPVTVHTCVPHSQMPAVFKAHRWLVYTADFMLKNVGWPLAVAEAHASGTGVIMANIRPDLKQYVGEAGYLYDDIDEVVDLIRGPVPEAWREAGFELAQRTNVTRNITRLTDLWKPALPA